MTTLNDRLEMLKQQLQGHEMDPAQKSLIEADIADIERQLALPEPPAPEAFLALLRDWEARLQVEHPVLAGMVSDVLRKLSDMGV